MSREHWVPIDGYEGWYEISDKGRVRSVDRWITSKNEDKPRFYKGQIMKFRYHNGYTMVNLNKNKKMKEFYVHRLVIENFTLHPKHKKWVNHKDGRKWNNELSNLEWCTPKENNDHAIAYNLRNNNIEGLLKHSTKRKKQVAFIRYGAIIHLEDCAEDMAKYLARKHIISEDIVEKARWAIRYACQSGATYKHMNFEYYKAS